MKKTVIKKTISMFLTILMIFSVISAAMPVFAENITTENTSQTVSEEVEVIAESEELRSENSKTYIMSDGSFKLDIYSYPVFVQNEDGDWIERETTSSTRRKAKSSSINVNEISATYVSSEEPNLNFSNESDAIINTDCIALIKPDSLAEFNMNFHVVSATLNLPVDYADENASVYKNKAFRKKYDISQGAVLFYSPYISKPNWNFSVLEQVHIPGVSSKSFLFYKYK